MRKHILPLLLCLIMVLSLMPTTALAAEVSVTYLDESGAEQNVTATEVTSGTTIGSGWYVVAANTNVSSLTVSGTTNIILVNGKTLTVSGGISGGGTLNIYAQTTTDARGMLEVQSSGISLNEFGIYGGDVTATGSDCGIKSNGSITIANSAVTANATGAKGTAIQADNNITMTNSTVAATAAGGYGIKASNGSIDIASSTVTATVSGGTGIEAKNDITIGTGSNVTAMLSGSSATGINSKSGNIIISSGTVTASGGTKAFSASAVTLTDNYADPAKRIVMVNTTATSTNAAKWNETALLTTYKYVRIAPPAPLSTPYLDEDGVLQTVTDAAEITSATTTLENGWYAVNEDVTIDGTVTLTTNTNLILADGKTLTVNVVSGYGIDCGAYNLTIYAQSTSTDMGKLVIMTNYGDSRGIGGGGNIKIVGGDIDISTEGSGSRGIYSDTGNISIYGGTVTATASGTDAWGIVGKNVSISGGTVTATVSGTNIVEAISGYAGVNISENADVTATASGERAIGIYCNNGNVNISGGTVNVTANEEWSFGIVCRGENVNISGGTVNVTVIDDNSVGVGSDEGDVAISGGTVTIIGGYNALYVTTTNAVTLTDNYADSTKRAVMVNTTATSTNATPWDETTRLDSTEYKYVRIAPVSAPTPAPTQSAMYGGTPIYWWSNQNPQPETTPTLPDVDTSAGALRNGPASIDKTVWLSGDGLVNNDLLITAPLSDAIAAVLLKNTLGEVIGAYDISLASGKTTTGNALTLHFDVGEKYAGQSFTLLHQKADGTVETFTAIADEKGIVSFSPIYELSPFVLIMNKSKAADNDLPPQTGDSFTAVGFIMIVAALAIAAAAKRKVFDNR